MQLRLIFNKTVTKDKPNSENFRIRGLVVFQQLRKLQLEWKGVCIPLRGNIPLGINSLFAACYRDVGRKNHRKRLIFDLIN